MVKEQPSSVELCREINLYFCNHCTIEPLIAKTSQSKQMSVSQQILSLSQLELGDKHVPLCKTHSLEILYNV